VRIFAFGAKERKLPPFRSFSRVEPLTMAKAKDYIAGLARRRFGAMARLRSPSLFYGE